MATYKTKAIILSSYPFREHDRIVTFFSGEFGKIEARARGLRKITSKLAGHLEPFIETELLLANGRVWDILAGSKTIKSREKLRSGVEKITSSLVCVEAVKRVAKPFSQDNRIYSLLSASFDAIEEAKSLKECSDIAFSFLWRISFLSGFGAELNTCIHCRKGIKSGSFSFEGGGMLCENCQNRDIMSKKVEEETLSELKSFYISTQGAREISELFWRAVIDSRPLNSLQFLRAL